MSEFNIEDLDAVIARSREGSLAQMLALQLKGQIRKAEQMAKEREAFTVECAAAKIALKYALSGRRDFILATPATDAYLAEIKSHDLNAFISHYSAELDEHIANGGDQFDATSIRLRGFIVGGRMFREKLREGADK